MIGTVTTLDGSQVLETITAPADGVPIFITSSPPLPTTACCSASA